MADDEVPSEQGLALMAKIVEKSLADTFAAGNAVTAAWQHRAEKAEATIDAIREGVARLFADGVMPTESRIKAALWPDAPDFAPFLANVMTATY